jgi:hypothetical protein
VLGNDTDADGDPLTAILNVDPTNGILTLISDGSFTYTPSTNFTGEDTFTYHANDGVDDSNIATVTITVNPIPIPDDTFTVIVRETSGIAIAGADVAVDHPGTAPQITDADGQATFSLPAGGTYVYTIEAAGYVTQEVSSANTVVDVILAEIDANSPPVANNNAYATDAETPLSIAALGVLENDTDADGDPLTAILNIDPSNGALTLISDGSFTYTPNTNFTGPDTFTYHANDGVDDSNIATVTITVNPIPIPDDTFTVIVSDTSGIAIAGADVAVDHPGTAPQITDADGRATFTLPVGGTYLYTIEAAGYVTQEVSSANTVVDVTLAETDSGGGGGGGGGGCFITAAAYDSNMGVQIGAMVFPTSFKTLTETLFGFGSSE